MAPLALIGSLQTVRDNFLPTSVVEYYELSWLIPNWPWEWYALIVLLITMVVAFEATFQSSRKIEMRLSELEEGWDRTGKYLVTIDVALQYLSKNLNVITETREDQQLAEAAAKIRELGWENQLKILGQEFDEESNCLQEYSQHIPPHFWKKNRLNVAAIRSGKINLPQTQEDNMVPVDAEVQPQFGNIRVSRRTLRAMVPERTS